MRRYLEEGTEIDGTIIEDTGYYLWLGGAWRWDESAQDAVCQTCGRRYVGDIEDHAETPAHKTYVREVRGW